MDTLYVCSKNRSTLLGKGLRSWTRSGVPLKVVVEENNTAEYEETVGRFLENSSGVSIEVVTLPESNMGIAYARQFCVEHAKENEAEVMAMCDDDVHLAYVRELMESAKLPGVAGVTSYFRTYTLFLDLARNNGMQIHRVGMGEQCVAFLTKNAVAVGGYDLDVPVAEDLAMTMALVAGGFGEWYINTDIEERRVGTSGQSGGCADMTLPKEVLYDKATKTLASKYGDDVVVPRTGKKHGCKIIWKEFHRRYNPYWKPEDLITGLGTRKYYRTLPYGGERTRIEMEDDRRI